MTVSELQLFPLRLLYILFLQVFSLILPAVYTAFLSEKTEKAK